jgi:hypothetical protein
MNIILRKVGGRLVPLFRSTGSRRSVATALSLGSVESFLFSPLVLFILAIAFAIAWATHASARRSPRRGAPHACRSSARPVKIKDLREKRAKTVAQARAILDTAEAAGRDLTAEERSNYDRAIADQESLRSRSTPKSARSARSRSARAARSWRIRLPPEWRAGARPQRARRAAQLALGVAGVSHGVSQLPAPRHKHLSAAEQRDLDATNRDERGVPARADPDGPGADQEGRRSRVHSRPRDEVPGAVGGELGVPTLTS